MSKKSSSGHPSKYACIGDLINFRNTLYTTVSHESSVSSPRQFQLSSLKYRVDIVKWPKIFSGSIYEIFIQYPYQKKSK